MELISDPFSWTVQQLISHPAIISSKESIPRGHRKSWQPCDECLADMKQSKYTNRHLADKYGVTHKTIAAAKLRYGIKT